MAHLLPFIDATPPCQPPEPPEPPLRPTQSINASPKSALLVENDESWLRCFKNWLEIEGYAVRTASNTDEGLRLYRDFAPFNVVLINYYVPPNDGVEIDCLAPQQTKSIALAMAIRNIDPSQGIIIVALDYQNAGEVPRPPELAHIPLLIETGNGQLRGLLEKVEVDRAINALTSSELLRLQQFSKFRIRGLGRAAGRKDWEDLLDEALLRTLIGAEDTQSGRHWNKKVSFEQHLTWAMSSIAHVWKRQFKEKDTYLVSEIPIHNAEGQEHSPLDNVSSGQVSADQRLIEKDEADRVFAMLKGDTETTQVLQGLLDGLKKNEITSRYGLDEKKYAATVKRMRLKLLGGKGNGGRG